MKVAVLGASAKAERYSHQAVVLLLAKGHDVFPVHPASQEICGLEVYSRLTQIPVALDVVTMYLAPARSSALENDLIQVRPRRVIFNPGTENPDLAATLQQVGIETIDACTLVLLHTGQFQPEPKSKPFTD